MMSEGQVRQLLATLTAASQKEGETVARVLAFSGGVSALQMVLGEDG